MKNFIFSFVIFRCNTLETHFRGIWDIFYKALKNNFTGFFKKEFHKKRTSRNRWNKLINLPTLYALYRLHQWCHSYLAVPHNFDTALHGSCHRPEHNWVHFFDKIMIEYFTGFWLSVCICNEHFEGSILRLDRGQLLLGPLHYFRVSIPSQVVVSIQGPNTSTEILGDAFLMSGSRWASVSALFSA